MCLVYVYMLYKQLNSDSKLNQCSCPALSLHPMWNYNWLTENYFRIKLGHSFIYVVNHMIFWTNLIGPIHGTLIGWLLPFSFRAHLYFCELGQILLDLPPLVRRGLLRFGLEGVLQNSKPLPIFKGDFRNIGPPFPQFLSVGEHKNFGSVMKMDQCLGIFLTKIGTCVEGFLMRKGPISAAHPLIP